MEALAEARSLPITPTLSGILSRIAVGASEHFEHPSPCSASYEKSFQAVGQLLTLLRPPQHKTLDVISLFHKPSVPSSLRVLTILKQVSALASETATEDQATDHSQQNKLQRTEFELNVTEEPPTSDQLRIILEYVGEQRASDVVDGAKDIGDAIRKLKENTKRFRAPVVG